MKNWNIKGAALALAMGGASAFAQVPGGSSVTLAGVVDVYGGKVQLAGRPNTEVVNAGALTTSRWGLTGSEDLGGGLRANFFLVAMFRPDSGVPGRFDGDAFFSSRSTVGLSGPFGQVNVGRMNSPLFFSLLRFDAHELGGLTPVFLHTFPGGQPSIAPQVVPDSTINNGIQYATPNWGGFTASVHASAAELPGKTKGRSGYSVAYSNGAFAIGAAGDSIDMPLAPTVTHQTAWMVGSSYDFKVLKLSASHQNHRQEGLGTEYNIDSLGASVPVGAAKVTGSWARTRLELATGAEFTRNTYGLTYDYFLSKRTDLYVHGLVDRVTNLARGTSLVAGIRHRF